MIGSRVQTRCPIETATISSLLAKHLNAKRQYSIALITRKLLGQIAVTRLDRLHKITTLFQDLFRPP